MTQRYVEEELAASSLQQFVAIVENFLSDAIRAWLLVYTGALSKRQLSGDDILGLPDKAAIVEALVEKELMDVFYDRPANWFKYLKDRVGIDVPSTIDVDAFAEVKATRDALVHGRGQANDYYVRKAGSAARVQSGEWLDVPEPYLEQSWQLICRLVSDVGAAMAAKARAVSR